MFGEKRHSLDHFSIPSSHTAQKKGFLDSLNTVQRLAIGIPLVVIGLPLGLDIGIHIGTDAAFLVWHIVSAIL